MSDARAAAANNTELLSGFPPAGVLDVEPGPRFLILGSFPSVASLERKEYYGNPRNHFWMLLSACFNLPLPVAYEEKIALLREAEIAVWDVFAACERKGSLDKNIARAKPNAVADFVLSHPSIAAIGTNGGAAAAFFVAEFAKGSGAGLLSRVGESFFWSPGAGSDSMRSILVSRLPSTSPVPTSGYRTAADKFPLWVKFFTTQM